MARHRRQTIAPRPTDAATNRQMRSRLNTLRMGVTGSAALGGLACYVFLAQMGIAPLLAGGIGLAFALLARVALASLARDWLMSIARRQANRDTTPKAPTTATHKPQPRR